MAGRFSVESVFRAVDKVTKPVTRMQNRINKFTRGAKRGLRGLNKQVDRLVGGLKRVAVAGAASLFLVTGAMGDVIRTGAEFEQTLVNAAAKFPEGIRKGSEAFKELEDVARKTGATTEFTASQAAAGLNFLAMAGFNAEQSLAALPQVVDLATAAQVDLATASDIATDTLGSFGLATKDAAQLGLNLARVNDVMAKTANSANTTMGFMMETIKDGGPVAKAAGASIETFAALTGVLANAGLKSSKAGTTLKNVFTKLAAPTGQAATVLRRLGVETQDADGNLRDIVDILEDYKKGLKGMGSAQQLAATNVIFGARAIAGVSVLLETGTDALREYRDGLNDATGTAKTLASVMRDTVQGRINSATSAFEGLKITLFKLKQVGIQGMIEGLTDFVRKIDGVVQANGALVGNLIDGFGKVGKGIFGIIGLIIALKIATLAVNAAFAIHTAALLIHTNVMKGYALAVKGAKLGMVAFNFVMAANPIGAVILAVVGLIALGVLLVKNWDSIVAAITSAASAIASVLTNVLFAPFKNITGGITSILSAAKGLGLFGGDEKGADGKDGAGAEGPQVVSPSDRIVRSIQENKETSTLDINVKDEGGRADVTQKGKAPGVNLKLQNSGGF